jgi:ATP-dependent RNA helicase SUPV3L1/SUV3
MEQALRSCTLWLWLDQRFEGVYGSVEDVIERRSSLNRGIERQLKAQTPLWRTQGRPARR